MRARVKSTHRHTLYKAHIAAAGKERIGDFYLGGQFNAFAQLLIGMNYWGIPRSVFEKMTVLEARVMEARPRLSDRINLKA